MAGSSVIGALRVDLGLNSAQFSAGLKEAQVGLARFGKTAGIALAGVTVAAAAAGAALGVAVKGAIDHADELSKASQKVGVSVETLSRLEYAAKLSDVSLEDLSTGLKKLSQTMATVAAGTKGAAATAFQALGVAVKNADGTLRSSGDVLIDIADRFSKFEDGATKTALAVQIFGRSGAELIPFLNEGRDGIAALSAEADRLGITLTQTTASGAEEFNDTLTRIGAVMDGVVNKVMSAALPALQSLANTLASPEFAQAAQTLATTLVQAFDLVVQAVVGTTNAVKGFLDWMQGLSGPTAGNGAPLLNSLLPGEKLNLADSIRSNSAVPTSAQELYAGFGLNSDGSLKVKPSTAPQDSPLAPIIFGAQEATKQLSPLKTAIDDIKPSLDGLTAAAKTMVDGLAEGFSGMVKAVAHGENALDALRSAFSRIADQLIDMASNQLINGLLGSLFGGMLGGGNATGGILNNILAGGPVRPGFNLPGFAGGGFTGGGARAGGMDGMGGFLAMLHPNETVVDHARGGGGPGVVINNYGSPDAVRTQTRPDGTLELFINEAVRRMEGNMAKGKYRPYGVTPGTRRT